LAILRETKLEEWPLNGGHSYGGNSHRPRHMQPSEGRVAAHAEPLSAGIRDAALTDAIEARLRTIVRDELARSRRAT
jgi:hypothetical protein